MSGEPVDQGRESDCAICGRIRAGRECRRCGDAVCAMHYSAPLGCCLPCADRATPDGRRGDAVHF